VVAEVELRQEQSLEKRRPHRPRERPARPLVVLAVRIFARLAVQRQVLDARTQLGEQLCQRQQRNHPERHVHDRVDGTQHRRDDELRPDQRHHRARHRDLTNPKVTLVTAHPTHDVDDVLQVVQTAETPETLHREPPARVVALVERLGVVLGAVEPVVREVTVPVQVEGQARRAGKEPRADHVVEPVPLGEHQVVRELVCNDPQPVLAAGDEHEPDHKRGNVREYEKQREPGDDLRPDRREVDEHGQPAGPAPRATLRR